MDGKGAPDRMSAKPSADRTPFYLALAFNAIPLAGVAFWGWSPFELIFLYWLENVIIGVRTFIAILLSGRFHSRVGAVAASMFFAVHYGIFCLVHGMFVISLFGQSHGANPHEAASFNTAIAIGVLAIIAWQTALLALHIYQRDESSPPELMFSPYPRIIVLHVTIIGGGFLLMALNSPYAGILVLAILKTAMDAAITLFGWKMHSDPKPATSPSITPPPSRPRP
jgi:hypothetical protein